jgi:hypothetical protein
MVFSCVANCDTCSDCCPDKHHNAVARAIGTYDAAQHILVRFRTTQGQNP